MLDEAKEKSMLLQELEEAKRRIADLERYHRQFVRFAENAHDVAYRIRLLPDRAFEYVSPGIEKITGYLPKEYYQDPDLPLKIVHPDDRTLLKEIFNSPERISDLTSFRFIHKDGHEVWTERRIVPVRDESGAIEAIEGVMRDITERKKAETILQNAHEQLERNIQERTADLRQSEQTLRALLNVTNDIAVLLGADGTILQINENGAKALGKSVEELIGTNGYAYFSSDIDKRRQELNEAVRKTGKPLRYEDEKDGRYFVISLYPIAGKKGDTQLAIFAKDITGEKKAKRAVLENEEKYRLLAENAMDIIWIRDLNLELTYISPSVLHVRGYTQEEAMTQNIAESMTAESVELARQVLVEELALENQIPKDTTRSRTLEVEMIHKDGSTVWTEVTLRFLRDENENPMAILGISRDVTDRKMVEEALRENEESTRLLYENFPIPSYTWKWSGSDFELVDYNRAAETATNNKVMEYIGTKLSEFIVDNPDLIEDVHCCYRNKGTFQNEMDYHFRTIDKKARVINTYAFIPPDRVVINQEDVTERRQAEAALIESEESARLQFKHFPIPTYTWQKRENDFVLIDYNIAAEEITQGKIDDYLGIVLSELYRDDRAIQEDVHQCFNEKISFKKEIDYQFRSTHDTRLMIVHYTFVPPDKVVVNTEDVTDRVLAEIALLESEEMFRAVTETAADAIFCKDLKGRYTLANPAMEKLLGLPASKIIGQKADDLFDEEAVIAVQEADGPAFQGKINSGIWTINIGSERYTFHVIEVPLLDAHNNVRGICGIVRDISDLQKAEQALRESEEKFRTIGTSALDAVILMDSNGNVSFWNPAAERMFGYTEEEILGKNVHETLMPKKYLQQFTSGFSHFLNTGEGYAVGKVLDLAARRKNGTEFPIEIAVSPIVLQGEFWASAIIRDITDRKRAEKEAFELNAFRENIIDNANIWLNVLDADMNVVIWNKAAETISGYTRDEVVGHTQVWSWLYPDETYRREVKEKAATIISYGEMVEGFETTIQRKDDEQRIISWFSRNLHDQSGNIIGSLALGLDVTNQHRAEEEKEALQDQLYHAQKMETVGTLAGGIAHDVNNILQTIFNNLYLSMEELDKNHPVQSHMQGILRAGRRAKDLIDQILTFSRHMDHERKAVEITPLIKEVIKMLQQAKPPNIRITHRIRKDCGAILADPSQIHQVIMNLATNAIHAMKESGGVLEIQLSRLSPKAEDKPTSVNLPAGNYVHLSVKDSGHGMDRAILARIFEPFFTTKQVGEGTGLGLSVAHGIVTAHGGKITVDSDIGKGTEFHIYLPAAERPAEAEKTQTPGIREGQGNLLYVDDDLDQLHLSHVILTKAGYNVKSVSSAGEAIAEFRLDPNQFDVVVTDQMMPVMSGIDMVIKMFRMRPALQVILITGKADDEIRMQAEKLGIAKVLAKPSDPAELINAIQELMAEGENKEV